MASTAKNPRYRGLTGPPSPRQLEILSLVARGNLTVQEMAVELGISESTVKIQLAKLRAKMGVKRTRHLIPLAQDLNREGK